MMNLQQLAINLIVNNPRVRNNPNAQEYLNVIQSGDSQRGEQIANNICQSLGMTREQATQQAMTGLGLRR